MASVNFFNKVIKTLKSATAFSLFQVFEEILLQKYMYIGIYTFTKMFQIKLFSFLSTFRKLHEKKNFTISSWWY